MLSKIMKVDHFLIPYVKINLKRVFMYLTKTHKIHKINFGNRL